MALEMWIVWLWRFKNIYAFFPIGNLKNTQGMALGENLSISGLVVET